MISRILLITTSIACVPTFAAPHIPFLHGWPDFGDESTSSEGNGLSSGIDRAANHADVMANFVRKFPVPFQFPHAGPSFGAPVPSFYGPAQINNQLRGKSDSNARAQAGTIHSHASGTGTGSESSSDSKAMASQTVGGDSSSSTSSAHSTGDRGSGVTVGGGVKGGCGMNMTAGASTGEGDGSALAMSSGLCMNNGELVIPISVATSLGFSTPWGPTGNKSHSISSAIHTTMRLNVSGLPMDLFKPSAQVKSFTDARGNADAHAGGMAYVIPKSAQARESPRPLGRLLLNNTVPVPLLESNSSVPLPQQPRHPELLPSSQPRIILPPHKPSPDFGNFRPPPMHGWNSDYFRFPPMPQFSSHQFQQSPWLSMDMDEVLEASKNLPGVSSAHLKTGSQSARDEGGIRTSGGANVGAGSFGPGDTKLAADVDSGSNSYNADGKAGSSSWGTADSSGNGNPLGIVQTNINSQTVGQDYWGIFGSRAVGLGKGVGGGNSVRNLINTRTDTVKNEFGSGGMSSGTGNSHSSGGGGDLLLQGGTQSLRNTRLGIMGAGADATVGGGGRNNNGSSDNATVTFNTETFTGDNIAYSSSSSSSKKTG